MFSSLLFCKQSTRVRVEGWEWEWSQHFLCKAFDIILHSLPWLNAFTWGKFNFWQEKYISVSSPCVPTFVRKGNNNEGVNNALDGWGRKKIRTKLEKMKILMDKNEKLSEAWINEAALTSFLSFHIISWLKLSLSLPHSRSLVRIAPHKEVERKLYCCVYIFD